MKKILSLLGAFFLVAFFLVITVLGYLAIDEYKPEDLEDVEIEGIADDKITIGKEYTIASWNIGYGALGDNADFFMDGGKMVYSADKKRVEQNLQNMVTQIDAISPDIMIFQEVDRNSSRSYFIDELESMIQSGTSIVFRRQRTYAENFNVSFIPLPVPPIGRVHAGIATLSSFNISSATRIKLPSPFKWPLKYINFKRCLLETRLPIEGSDKEFVLINLHLEAYDDGEGKVAQTNMLKEILYEEYAKGNYVIAGGDFNQLFSNIDTSAYPQLENRWAPGVIEASDFGDDFTLISDNSIPSCRSLDAPLVSAGQKDPEHFQYYVLDGFIVSSNIEIMDVRTIDTFFEHADHNPVTIKFYLH